MIEGGYMKKDGILIYHGARPARGRVPDMNDNADSNVAFEESRL